MANTDASRVAGTSPPIEVVTPPVADPGPLGLAGFALTTFCLSVFNAGLIATPGLSAVVLPVALFYGGIAQMLAGMWEFKKNNTFGALAFTSYGAFWLSFAAYVKFVAGPIAAAAALPAATAAQKTVATDVHLATGLFLLAWTIFTAYMLIAALRTNGAIIAVFAVLTVTFALLTIGELAEMPSLVKLGGWTGIVTAVLAWYGSFAGVTNATWGRTVVPTWPVKK